MEVRRVVLHLGSQAPSSLYLEPQRAVQVRCFLVVATRRLGLLHAVLDLRRDVRAHVSADVPGVRASCFASYDDSTHRRVAREPSPISYPIRTGRGRGAVRGVVAPGRRFGQQGRWLQRGRGPLGGWIHRAHHCDARDRDPVRVPRGTRRRRVAGSSPQDADPVWASARAAGGTPADRSRATTHPAGRRDCNSSRQ